MPETGWGRGLLTGKNAVVYGAAGSIGSAVSSAFAREGARVFLAGRTVASLDELSNSISRSGGAAEVAQVDARDRSSVETHLKMIADSAGGVDVSFNLISNPFEQEGKALIELTTSNFEAPTHNALSTQFITSTAAARHMVNRGKGVILSLVAVAGQRPPTNMGGWPDCNSALEGYSRHLATELGPHGVRVVCIRTAGSPDARGMPEIYAYLAEKAGVTVNEFRESLFSRAVMKRMPLCAEIGNVAVLLASDYASPITGALINASCGMILD
jgi:3-oxoacyl-[acyl-carrier protein] reductase